MQSQVDPLHPLPRPRRRPTIHLCPAMLKPAVLHKLRPGRAKLNLPAKRAAPFYLSPEWKQLIASIKQKRGHYCQHPQHPAGVPDGRAACTATT